MRLTLSALFLALILPACTAGQVYTGLQTRERNLCAQGPAEQYRECMARQEMDYDEYQKFEKAAPPSGRPEKSGGDGNEQRVRDFTAAFNRQDVSAMLSLTTDDIRWMSVDGAEVSVETGDANELRQAMEEYFDARTSSRSRLLDIHANGPFVTTLEQAGSEDRAGQCAIAVYEFSDRLIKNVWYYRAHSCEEMPAD